ncbi:hypothetical protein WCP94_001042 [Bilophila wadsworthia]
MERRRCSLFQTAAFPTKEPFSHPLEERALFADSALKRVTGCRKAFIMAERF